MTSTAMALGASWPKGSVDEDQLMSTEQLPPENEGLEASTSGTPDAIPPVDADRITSPGEGSINYAITPRPVGPLGIAQHRTPPGPSGALTPQSHYSPLPPAHIAWPPPGASTPQSAHVPIRPVPQLNPNLFSVSDRKVRVADNEDVSCYALARRWLENDPDGCANPAYLSRIKTQGAAPGMGPYPGGLGIPGEHPSVPQFWELDPISLPPRLPESTKEASPPPRIKPLKEEKKKDKSLDVKVPIEKLQKSNLKHWKAVRAHFKKNHAEEMERYRPRLGRLLGSAQLLKTRADAYDLARKEAAAAAKKEAEAREKADAEARAKAQAAQALTSGNGALPLGSCLPPSMMPRPSMSPLPQAATPSRNPGPLGPPNPLRSPLQAHIRPPLHPTTPNPRPFALEPSTPTPGGGRPGGYVPPASSPLMPQMHAAGLRPRGRPPQQVAGRPHVLQGLGMPGGPGGPSGGARPSGGASAYGIFSGIAGDGGASGPGGQMPYAPRPSGMPPGQGTIPGQPGGVIPARPSGLARPLGYGISMNMLGQQYSATRPQQLSSQLPGSFGQGASRPAAQGQATGAAQPVQAAYAAMLNQALTPGHLYPASQDALKGGTGTNRLPNGAMTPGASAVQTPTSASAVQMPASAPQVMPSGSYPPAAAFAGSRPAGTGAVPLQPSMGGAGSQGLSSLLPGGMRPAGFPGPASAPAPAPAVAIPEKPAVSVQNTTGPR